MENVVMFVEHGLLRIEVKLDHDAGPSKSGKSIIVASTEGNAVIRDEAGRAVSVGLNVFRKNE